MPCRSPARPWHEGGGNGKWKPERLLPPSMYLLAFSPPHPKPQATSQVQWQLCSPLPALSLLGRMTWSRPSGLPASLGGRKRGLPPREGLPWLVAA